MARDTPTDWTTPADVQARLQRLWDRDALWQAEFPMRLPLRMPTAAAQSNQLDAVGEWIALWQRAARRGGRVVLREVRHRLLGTNALPAEVWFDTRDDALRLIGLAEEGRQLAALLDATQSRFPALLPWMQQQPRRCLALADDWSRLLDLIAWLEAHPRPGVYLRQVDVPGIHSKFVEQHRGVLSALLDQVLGADAVLASATGASQFAARYGLRDKPLRVRLRFLDPLCNPWLPDGDGDFTLTARDFARVSLPVRRVFITENEVNFLAFPPVAGGLALFGAGYGFDGLAPAAWLQSCEMHYWGDIDTHGFAILDQLRERFPDVRALLMDHATLLAHESLWVTEPQPTQRDLSRLHGPERRLYDDLRWCRLRDTPIRLEQERIGYAWVSDAVARAVAG